MKSILDLIFIGKMHANTIMKEEETERKLSAKRTKIENAFMKCLSEAQKKEYFVFEREMNATNAEDDKNSFEEGIKIGILIGIESMKLLCCKED